jgi:hypothetical protein
MNRNIDNDDMDLQLLDHMLEVVEDEIDNEDEFRRHMIST